MHGMTENENSSGSSGSNDRRIPCRGEKILPAIDQIIFFELLFSEVRK
jgi:hypothetical protein